jgi:hypothetical protein
VLFFDRFRSVEGTFSFPANRKKTIFAKKNETVFQKQCNFAMSFIRNPFG